jgi:hypothetical protein
LDSTQRVSHQLFKIAPDDFVAALHPGTDLFSICARLNKTNSPLKSFCHNGIAVNQKSNINGTVKPLA